MRSALAEASSLFSAMTDALAPEAGKMVRPALLLLSARSGPLWPARREDAIRAAAAVELLHLATLAHDDVIDASDLRRGRPTPRARFGDREAVLLGDYVFASSYRAGSGAIPDEGVAVLARAAGRICEGEILQGRARWNAGLGERRYLRGIHAKTAALFSASARVGAAVAGADAALSSRLGRIGSALGMAFQISDDILDLSGDAKRLGKPAGSDLSEGVFTLPVIIALREEASAAGDGKAGPLRRLLSRYPYNARNKRRIANLIGGYGGPELARTRAAVYSARARAAIASLPPGEAREGLTELEAYLSWRES